MRRPLVLPLIAAGAVAHVVFSDAFAESPIAMSRSRCNFRLPAHQSSWSCSATDAIAITHEATYEAILAADRAWDPPRRPSFRIFRRGSDDPDGPAPAPSRFTYDYDELVVGNASKPTTDAVVLVHPIGVGIGKWYYDRLLRSLRRYDDADRLAFLVPDLLGSATASDPFDADGRPITKLPLLNITDWAGQMTALMAEYEASCEAGGNRVASWSVVANGGCAPIALKVASDSLRKPYQLEATVTNVVISSPPRLPFFLEGSDPARVGKSYRTLSGVVGRLFWWYCLRKNGRFVQKFSEQNLIGDARNLGEEWTPNCLKAARLQRGCSRYSTFAFLAGALQDGCAASLAILRGSSATIDFIRGSDRRRNRAKSWFWRRKRNARSEPSSNRGYGNKGDAPADETIQEYVVRNGNRGKELCVNGRISLAWEDPDGYAKGLMELLCK
ncbi:hypothetical protein ACHAWF_011420 [Thalassiosira exigua]